MVHQQANIQKSVHIGTSWNQAMLISWLWRKSIFFWVVSRVFSQWRQNISPKWSLMQETLLTFEALCIMGWFNCWLWPYLTSLDLWISPQGHKLKLDNNSTCKAGCHSNTGTIKGHINPMDTMSRPTYESRTTIRDKESRDWCIQVATTWLKIIWLLNKNENNNTAHSCIRL